MKRANKPRIASLLILHLGVLIYSVSAVFMKTASGFPPFSPRFFLYYGLSLLALFLYALVWQQTLRRFPLGTAYINRSASAVWSLLFGLLFFSETITIKHLAGILVILAGMFMVVRDDE